MDYYFCLFYLDDTLVTNIKILVYKVPLVYITPYKFHATNKKAQNGLHFFLIQQGGKDKEIFKIVPNEIPSNSQEIPIRFSTCSQVPNACPKLSLVTLHFLSHIVQAMV